MKLQGLPDEKLLHTFSSQQDPLAFEELVKRHQTYIIKRCYTYLKDMDDAQDVAQEVLIRLLTKSETYRQDAPFMPWLNTIIRNRCMDHLNQDKKELHQEISRQMEETIQEAYDTDEVDKPTLEILEELLEQVGGEEKLLLLLKYWQGWSVQDIQQSLNLNENTVKSKLKRSREKLRKLLTHYRDDQAA